jgi:tetratricopeptide (TPR) repeat protein
MDELMSEPDNAGKYQVNIDGTVQGPVIGDNPTVHQHFYATQDKAPSSTKPQRVWNIPYLRNDYFTGREEILEQLHTRFKANNATALTQRHAMSGLGGIGKTQTAVEYAYRYHEDYQAVLWARAESHEALTSSFVEIAALLDLPQKNEQDQTITVQAVKHWLQNNSGWLLILDNADEPQIVHEFLPTKFDGHILLTTRAQALGGLAQRIEVDTFTPELSVLFLLRRATLIDAHGALKQASPEDRKVATKISEELGGLPLALDQAGAYIEETKCNLAKYLECYQIQRARLLKRRGSNSDYPASVATTWSLSFERVEQNAVAADLLRLCAFLAPDAIPEEIIIKGASYLGEHLQAVLEDQGLLDEAIGILRAYSLIHRDPVEKTLSIHRLVQAVLRDAMPAEETKLWAERTVLAVNAVFPHPREFAQWLICERYLPHAQACYGLMTQDQMSLSEVAGFLTKIGWYLRERGQYQEAEAPLQQALTLREQNLGSEHLDTALSLSVLGLLYHAQGQYEQAEPLYVRALSIYEKQLGANHPSTATSLNNLAGLYRSQGKDAQAEPLYVRALSIYEKQLGANHPNTATCLNNLALLYNNQGKYAQAEPLYVQALSIYEKQLGANHPNTATCLNNLATLYKSQGKYAQAEPLYLRALSIRQQKLGETHPDTRAVQQSYASLLRAMGRYEEAKQLKRGNSAQQRQSRAAYGLYNMLPLISETINRLRSTLGRYRKHKE